jgi:hypothetical protein
MVSRRGLAALVAIALAGCQTVTPEAERPARMIDADDDSRAALGRGVDTLMGTHVTLAPDALTDSSYLTIETMPKPSMENPVPLGRDLRYGLYPARYADRRTAPRRWNPLRGGIVVSPRITALVRNYSRRNGSSIIRAEHGRPDGPRMR